MSSTDLKSLKKLAETCRKVGISHFKGPEFEFTLTPDAPVSEYKKKKEEKSFEESQAEAIDQAFSSDNLPEETLLMWSALDPSSEKSES